MNDIRIAAVIMNCPVGRVEDNLDRMAGWVRTAKKQAADLVCFPEMNVTGYSTRDKIKESTESVPGLISQSILAMAAESKIVILAGMAEKDTRGRVFASHLVVTPQSVAGIYRKITVTHPALSRAWAGLGIAQDALGDGAEALGAYQRAVRLNGLAPEVREYAMQRIATLMAER